jgi:hypothetical protein
MYHAVWERPYRYVYRDEPKCDITVFPSPSPHTNQSLSNSKQAAIAIFFMFSQHLTRAGGKTLDDEPALCIVVSFLLGARTAGFFSLNVLFGLVHLDRPFSAQR